VVELREVARKVRLSESIDADTVAISKDYYFANAFVVDLPLETVPDHVWQDIFEREWKSGRHLWDRRLFVVGEKLRLVTTVNDIEDKLDWVKQVIERTNRDIDECNQEAAVREAQIKGDVKSQVLKEEQTSVDMIRDLLRKRLGAYLTTSCLSGMLRTKTVREVAYSCLFLNMLPRVCSKRQVSHR
jgi:nucleotidyltransferase/DNA polymerase involved in DNA repair